MSTFTKKLRKMPWLYALRKGALVFCFALLLLSVGVPAAFASARSQHSDGASSTSALKKVISLGLAGPGGVVMINDTVGWVLSNGLRRTSDGGKTWQTVAQASSQELFGATYILDDQVAWYLTYDAQTFAPAALYRTNDGGQNWTRFAWNYPTQVPGNLGVIDGQTAWVAASDYSGDTPSFHLYLVGGVSQSVQEVALPAQTQSGLGDTYFVSPQVGWVTSVTPNDNGNQAYSLFATSDGGQTWTQENLPIPAGLSDTATTVNIRFVGFGDSQQGYLSVQIGETSSYMIYSTQIYRTLDGGQTWQSYGAPVPQNTRLIQIDNWYVPNADIVFVAIGGVVGLGELQAGAWSTQSFTLPASNSDHHLTALSPKDLYVSVESSDYTAQLLYQSPNGGKNWKQIASIPN
jgi:photosystem II stability/assembly factor-like uncharacterized protein